MFITVDNVVTDDITPEEYDLEQYEYILDCSFVEEAENVIGIALIKEYNYYAYTFIFITDNDNKKGKCCAKESV